MNPTRIALPPEVRAAMVERLQSLTFSGIDLSLRGKIAHWNVQGPLFGILHPLFDEVVDAARDWYDTTAERALQLGGSIEGTPSQVVAGTQLPQPQGATTTPSMNPRANLMALADALGSYGNAIRAAITMATELGDDVSSNMLAEIGMEADKLLWKLEASARDAVGPA